MSIKHVVSVEGDIRFPRGFTISDNRIEDELQKFLSPSAYCIWRQYLRFWGSNKKRAYPSLSYLSEATGLAERTIRKCNKELIKKKFLKKKSGDSTKSNSYFYVPIEDIIRQCKVENIIVEEEHTELIREQPYNFDKVIHIIDKSECSSEIRSFIYNFCGSYVIKFGFDYTLEEDDAQALIKNVNLVKEQPRIFYLIKLFFKTKNEYIDESDRSIYLFFRPKVLKALISEYANSDEGRWEAQAEKMWKEVGSDLIGKTAEEIETLVKAEIHFGSANKIRDEFVIKYLIDKAQK